MLKPSLQFCGIQVRAARHFPGQPHAMANMELVLSGRDVQLKPAPASADHFLLVRRGDNDTFHVNSLGLADYIQTVDAESVRPLLAALESGADVTLGPDTSRDTFQRALARMKEPVQG